MKLSDTQSLILSKASQHPERLAAAPQDAPRRGAQRGVPLHAQERAARRVRRAARVRRLRLARGRGRRPDRAPHHRGRPARHRRRAGRGRRAGHRHGGRHGAHGGAGRAPRIGGGRSRPRKPPRTRPAAPDEATRAEDLARQDQPCRARAAAGRHEPPRKPRRPCSTPGTTMPTAARSPARWSASAPCWPSPPVRRAIPTRRASRARAPSRRRCWPCCAGRRARPSRRSPRPPAGRRTRCAASSPGSRRRASRSRCWSASARSGRTRRAPRAATPSTASWTRRGRAR